MPDPLLSSLVIRTNRLDACAQFYWELGLTLTQERHGDGPLHYSARSGDVLLEFYPAGSKGDLIGEGMMIGFHVADLDDTLSRLRSGNAPLVKAPEDTRWGRRAVVVDPDGRKVEIYEREVSRGAGESGAHKSGE